MMNIKNTQCLRDREKFVSWLFFRLLFDKGLTITFFGYKTVGGIVSTINH